MPGSIAVAVDFTTDDTVVEACSYRERQVYPKLAGNLISQTTLLTGSHANGAEAAAAFSQNGVALITGVAHGDADSFPGISAGTPILATTIGGFDPNQISGRIIHLVSCDTAQFLGRALADPNGGGAAAFFGYSGNFTWPTGEDAAFADLIFDCDAQIDFAIANGQTAAEAFAAAFNKYTSTYNDLMVQGTPRAQNIASIVKLNRDMLCGPSVDNEYGSSKARLA